MRAHSSCRRVGARRMWSFYSCPLQASISRQMWEEEEEEEVDGGRERNEDFVLKRKQRRLD